MAKAVWLLAGAVLVFSSAARAADEPAAPMTDFSRGIGTHAMPSPPQNAPAIAPTAPVAPAAAAESPPKQSPEALTCVNSDGKAAPAQRAEACSSLIDQHKWKGKEIAWAYANRCAAHFRLKLIERALADCSEAIDQDAETATAWQLRGEIHRQRDARAKALEDFDKAVALGVKNAALFSARGTLRLLDGDAARALEDFEQETAIAGGAAEAFMDRGSAHLGLGEDAKAEQDFAKAVQLAPKNAQAWLNRGVAAFGAGEKTKAAEFFAEALKLNPSDSYSALWRFFARDASEPAKAELQIFADKATNKDWPFAVTQLYLGRAGAAETLGAANGDDQLCEARFYVAESQLMKGAAPEAIIGFKRAVESCPKNFIEYFRAVAELKAVDARK